MSPQIDYPEIAEGIMPRHRFMSAYEQRIEPPDRRWQYLLMAAEPYETIAFKVAQAGPPRGGEPAEESAPSSPLQDAPPARPGGVPLGPCLLMGWRRARQHEGRGLGV